MGRIIAGLALLLTIYVCATIAEKKQAKEVAVDSYVTIDTSVLKYKYQAYVPVNLQPPPGKSTGKIVLRIRNTSFADSIYLSRVEYYNKQGKLLKGFIDSARLIKPMATSELTIKGHEFKEPGDNFIVQWHSNNVSKPLIQAISFDPEKCVAITDHGVVISDEALILD